MKSTINIGATLVLFLVIGTVFVLPVSGNPQIQKEISWLDENTPLSTANNGHPSAPLAHCNTPDLSSDANVYLTFVGDGYSYEVIGSASEPVEAINISTRMYRYNNNDRSRAALVFELTPVICSNTDFCSDSGILTPMGDDLNETGTFFVNATILFSPYDECESL